MLPKRLHPLDPLCPPDRRLPRLAVVEPLAGDLAVTELHDADGVERVRLVIPDGEVIDHRSWRPIVRHGRADDRARLQPLLPLELCSVGCPSSVEPGARESSVLLAGRGRPPQAAARRPALKW